MHTVIGLGFGALQALAMPWRACVLVVVTLAAAELALRAGLYLYLRADYGLATALRRIGLRPLWGTHGLGMLLTAAAKAAHYALAIAVLSVAMLAAGWFVRDDLAGTGLDTVVDEAFAAWSDIEAWGLAPEVK